MVNYESEVLIDHLSIDTGLQFASFQQGFGEYTGTVDTYITGEAPGENFSTFDSLNVDGSSGGFPVQALIRFDDIFGVNPGQITFNARIITAALDLEVNNQGDRLEFYRMLTPWDNTTTWNSLEDPNDLNNGPGIQKGVEVSTIADATTPNEVENGLLTVNVTNSIKAWQADPTSNNGWAILPTDTNGVDFFSAEGETPPALVIQYSVNELTGTANNDTIDSGRGTSLNDVIRGLAGNDDLKGRSGDDLLIGGTGNDTLNGGHDDDVIIGVDVNALNPGSAEVDVIIGSANITGSEDIIVLGDTNNVFYSTSGIADRAIIKDFDAIGNKQDKIQLKGTASDYTLESVTIGTGTNTQTNTNILYVTPSGQPELIATVEGLGTGTADGQLNLLNTTNFDYV